MREDTNEVHTRPDRVTRAPIGAVFRAIATFVSGMSVAGGLGLVGIGAVGLVLTVGGFACAHHLDAGSGPFSGDFGLASLMWLIVALFLGPASLGSLAAGALALLFALGLGGTALASVGRGSAGASSP